MPVLFLYVTWLCSLTCIKSIFLFFPIPGKYHLTFALCPREGKFTSLVVISSFFYSIFCFCFSLQDWPSFFFFKLLVQLNFCVFFMFENVFFITIENNMLLLVLFLLSLLLLLLSILKLLLLILLSLLSLWLLLL